MKKTKKRLPLIIFSALFALAIGELIHSNLFFKTTEYNLKADNINGNLKIVFISDLHNKEYGDNNKNLIEKIAKQSPDFIAVGGDMVTRTFVNDDNMKNILSKLSKIAPVYCCLGNHERDIADKIDFKTDITACGATLLDNEAAFFTTKDGQKILIGGLSDYPYYGYNGPDYDVPEAHYWEQFNEEANNYYTILLHHQPEYITDMVAESNVELVLCGHTHGGLVRIPFVGGVIAPNQGLFPQYDKGEFDFNNTSMIITGGLGVSNPIPRFNNQPEICIINITKGNS